MKNMDIKIRYTLLAVIIMIVGACLIVYGILDWFSSNTAEWMSGRAIPLIVFGVGCLIVGAVMAAAEKRD